jgi:hypothetical protein
MLLHFAEQYLCWLQRIWQNINANERFKTKRWFSSIYQTGVNFVFYLSSHFEFFVAYMDMTRTAKPNVERKQKVKSNWTVAVTLISWRSLSGVATKQ